MKPTVLMDRIVECVRAVTDGFPMHSLAEPDACEDLACRLILEFSRRGITIVPTTAHDELTALRRCVNALEGRH